MTNEKRSHLQLDLHFVIRVRFRCKLPGRFMTVMNKFINIIRSNQIVRILNKSTIVNYIK